jgi:hypothetical protein
VKVRNIGSAASYIKTGVWAPTAFACANLLTTGGNNSNVKIQKCFVGRLRTGLFTTINSDKGVIVEQVLSQDPWLYSTKGIRTELIAWLNSPIKGMTSGGYMATAQTSVYGTHFIEQFLGGKDGALIIAMNEPTAETTTQWSNPTGVAKFNSAGGIEMRVIGAEAIWEMPHFAEGWTGFANITPVMAGGTIGNYTITYQIDTGTGWNGTWKTLNTTNLTAESFTEFKLKIKIVTSTGNSTAITFLRIALLTTKAAQEAITYPLDTITLTLTGLLTESDVVILPTGTETMLANPEDVVGTTYAFTYETPQSVDIRVYKQGYYPFSIVNYPLGSSNASVPIAQRPDDSYLQ